MEVKIAKAPDSLHKFFQRLQSYLLDQFRDSQLSLQDLEPTRKDKTAEKFFLKIPEKHSLEVNTKDKSRINRDLHASMAKEKKLAKNDKMVVTRKAQKKDYKDPKDFWVVRPGFDASQLAFVNNACPVCNQSDCQFLKNVKDLNHYRLDQWICNRKEHKTSVEFFYCLLQPVVRCTNVDDKNYKEAPVPLTQDSMDKLAKWDVPVLRYYSIPKNALTSEEVKQRADFEIGEEFYKTKPYLKCRGCSRIRPLTGRQGKTKPTKSGCYRSKCPCMDKDKDKNKKSYEATFDVMTE